MDSPIASSYPPNPESSRTGGMQSLAAAGGAAAGAPIGEGFSASNSTASSPPDPRTPPVSAQDLYAPSSYTDSFASLSSDATTTTNSTNTTHPPSLPHHSAGIPAPHHPVQHQHQPGQQPPQFPPSRRGSFLEDLYTPSHSPSSHDFPNAAAHHHIPPPAHHAHHHPHQQQQEVSPLSRPLSDLAPGALGSAASNQQQQQQAPLPRISTQFDDPSWPPATVSPEMTQHQPTSAVSPTTTLNGPYPNSTGGGDYGHNSGGGAGGSGTGSGSATPQQGMFHHGHTPQPPFARRFSSPLVGGAPPNRVYEAGGSALTIGAGANAAPGGGSPHSFPSLGQPDANHMAGTSFGAGNFAFRPPPLYEDGQDMSDRFEGVANGPASHTTGVPVRTSKKAAATMAAMGLQQHTPPGLEQQHVPPPHERSLSHSFSTPPEWEDSKNVLVPQHHHHQPHYVMPPMAGVPEMPLRPLAHAHSMQ
ncbi:hypothetical protein FRC01_011049 [Tulasnella sp. 417]|nr:hypothetical protein FRC01_011049 [Tulasnella sp. 417]